jgi:methyl-accepting chemotaxis protein
MKKILGRQNIRTKLIIFILAPAIIIMAGILATLILSSRAIAQVQSDAILETIAKEHGSVADAELEIAMDASRTLAQVMQGFEDTPMVERRSDFSRMLRLVLEANPNFIGVWTCWEPYALDGLDGKLANTVGYDASGRFVPYWNRFGGQISLVPLVDYTVAGAGDYYLLARDSGEEIITEPYRYEVGGKAIWLTSLVVPIKDSKGKVVGAAGVDVDTSHLQELFGEVKAYQTGYGRLLSAKGVVITHFDPTRIGKLGGEFDGSKGTEIFNAMQKGEVFSGIEYSEALKMDTLKVYAPIFVGKAKTPWIFSIAVPQQEPYQDINTLKPVRFYWRRIH